MIKKRDFFYKSIIRYYFLSPFQLRKRIALTMRLDDEPGSAVKRDRPSENNTRKDTRPPRSAPLEQAQGNSAMADAFAKLKRW